MLSEISQTEEDKYCMYIYMWNQSFFKKSNSHKEKETGCQGVGKIGKRVQTQL